MKEAIVRSKEKCPFCKGNKWIVMCIQSHELLALPYVEDALIDIPAEGQELVADILFIDECTTCGATISLYL